MNIGRYSLHRLVSMIITLLGTSLVTFMLVRLAPGDPVERIIGLPSESAVGGMRVSEERREALRAELGLDQPLPVQYVIWLGRIVQLDLGTSFRSRQPVAVELANRLPATIALAGSAFCVQCIVAFTFGILAAVKANRWADQVIRFASVAVAACPSFLIGLLLLMLFAVQIPWYTISGPARLDRLTLPAVTLGVISAPTVLRVLRTSLLDEFGRLYIIFGRAKGLPERRVILQHVIPNALLPVITLMGLNLASLLSGAVIIETVFTWPGIGKYAVDSIFALDYPVIQGYVLLTTAMVILTNALVDITYVALDPRLRTPENQ